MRQPILAQHVWVLVCDARKSLLLQNMGDHIYPKLELRHAMEHQVNRSSALGADAPGRTISSADGRRASVDQGDPHLDEERNFLHGVVQDLTHRVERRELENLIIVAPPRALGLLRDLMGEQLKKNVSAEIAHDYVKLPLYEIEKRLTQAPTVTV